MKSPKLSINHNRNINTAFGHNAFLSKGAEFYNASITSPCASTRPNKKSIIKSRPKTVLGILEDYKP